MRLIDADRLLSDKMKKYYYHLKNGDIAIPIIDIEHAPTIDAVSVVHGEWMPNPKIGWGETWVCSICGEKTTSSVMGYPRYNYCPMCGAKMKGADDE